MFAVVSRLVTQVLLAGTYDLATLFWTIQPSPANMQLLATTCINPCIWIALTLAFPSNFLKVIDLTIPSVINPRNPTDIKVGCHANREPSSTNAHRLKVTTALRLYTTCTSICLGTWQVHECLLKDVLSWDPEARTHALRCFVAPLGKVQLPDLATHMREGTVWAAACIRPF